MVNQVVPAFGVTVSVQLISIVLGSVSGTLGEVLAVNWKLFPLTSSGWVTPFASLMTNAICELSVAPCSTQSCNPGWQEHAGGVVVWIPIGWPVAGIPIGGGVVCFCWVILARLGSSSVGMA